MKIRSDFVSNSSSTSFIIRMKDVQPDELDVRFFNIIGHCKHLYFSLNDSTYSEELQFKLKDVFKEYAHIYDDSIEIDLDGVDGWTNDSINAIKQAMVESENMTCSYGCDDCGEYVAEAAQICTILELLYGIVPKGEDHFNYYSIERMGLKNENKN